jgi:hypothetical protein
MRTLRSGDGASPRLPVDLSRPEWEAFDVATNIKHYQMFINERHTDADQADEICDPGRPSGLDAYAEVTSVALDLRGGRVARPCDLLLSHADN